MYVTHIYVNTYICKAQIVGIPETPAINDVNILIYLISTHYLIHSLREKDSTKKHSSLFLGV